MATTTVTKSDTELLMEALAAPIVKPVVKKVGLPSFDQLQQLQRDVKEKRAELNKATIEEVVKEDGDKKKTIVIFKKPKEALPLEQFCRTVTDLQKPTLFYRYIRPNDIKNKQAPWSPGNKGGVCLLINLTNSGFRFAFSICRDTEVFVKDEAQKRCQDRFTNQQVIYIERVNREASFLENIRFGIDNFFKYLNKDTNEPLIRFSPEKVNPYTVRKLARIIEREFQENRL